MNKKTIILDLDDTLIDTSHLYWLVKDEILTFINKCTNIEKKILDIEFESIENENIKVYGHDPLRYTYSAIELCKRNGISNYEVVQSIAKKIIEKDPELINGAEELLKHLFTKYNLTLLTRGEEVLQYRKITNNGLDKYFNKNNIKVVKSKSAKVFKEFIATLSLKPNDCIVIGDSIKSDINPAIECGIPVLHYKYRHEYYEWQQDKAETNYDFQSFDSLEEIKNIL